MLYVGIDLGGTNIAAGLVDDEGSILFKGSVPTAAERGYEPVVKDMADLAAKMAAKAPAGRGGVRSIGIGSPGTIDSATGSVVYSNNLGFVNVPMVGEMRRYTDLPILIGNDANVAALAESTAGAAKGIEHSVTVTLGTGVGGGVVIGGKVYSGFNDAAAELGHMCIMMDGEMCTCGKRGCWEAYASATALIRQTKAAAAADPGSAINSLVSGDLGAVNAKTAFDAAKAGDAAGRAVVDAYIRYVAVGLRNIINIFMPEVIVIGGGISKEGDYILTPLSRIAHAEAYTDRIKLPAFKIAQMGNDAGIVGAAMLGK
ncbi:MAG: ROK family protein [Oscillospiraceae bacterium]|nr:ROK family protein [Oscillospiraceae bacterium]